MENQIHEAIQFFKNEKVYDKLFKAFRKKYESLGRIGGTVPVGNFSAGELEEVGKFFGLLGEQLEMKGSISLIAFEKQIEYTRFSSVTLKPLLDAYFGETLTSKKEQRKEKEASLREFLNKQKEQYSQLAFWFQFLQEQKREARWIVQIAEQETARFKILAETLDLAYNSLPQQAERLPMFSQRITGDPHAFDLQTDLGRMFIHLLSIHRAGLEEGMTVEIPSSTEGINELLEQYDIYRDDLLNFVTCANLIAETACGVHPVWETAANGQTVQIIPLRELVSLITAYPMEGDVVWVVENSGVCATLLDYKPETPIICTNGQFTLATWLLMDLLVKAKCKLYYAGDFDPEGLGMAQRLLDRYPDFTHLWQMDKASYRKSNPTKEISAERLEKLKGIRNEELKEVAEEMKCVGVAGYQEALVNRMVEDLKAKKTL